MEQIDTRRLAPDSTGIASAAEILRNGGLVAFPTETVYGLGADARNEAAVAGIYSAKGRPGFNPLIVHVADLTSATAFVTFNDVARALAEAFWPGPLTLVLPLNPASGISTRVTVGLPTLAVRVPATNLARDLLRAFDGPVAAPSANPSGRVSPTAADHVLDGLSGRIDAVLDGGTCNVGLESTIIGFDPDPVLLRPGGVPAEAIEDAIGQKLNLGPVASLAPSAPGQLASHYAPNAPIRLNATTAHEDETLLGFGSVKGDLSLSDSGDLNEAAANLFGMLRQLDDLGARQIAVAPIPDHGIGRAINDRLTRAAAPRD